ncbi:MAG: hypothetical protein O7C67_09695 [Gammaproteobacteria bacterium]|nr:hypothetical protein [Gammaproteobacteria bacterium]
MSARSICRLRLSLLQTMKLVVFVAAGLAFVSTVLRDSGSSVVSSVLFSGVAVPLLWVALSFILIRRGPRRDRAILLLLIFSVSVTLVAAIWILWSIASHIRAIPPGIAA